MPLYFAYGSNLHSPRLVERVGQVQHEGAAKLAGVRLSFRKRGRDGSGKACFEAAAGESLWGALYRLSPSQFAVLDGFEPDYRRITVSLTNPRGQALGAETYQAEAFTDDPIPYDWYLALMRRGACEHALPKPWRDHLARFPSRPGRAPSRGTRDAPPPRAGG